MHAWQKEALRIISIGGVIYLLVCIAVFIYQRRLIYFPSAEIVPLPPDFTPWRNAAQELHGYKRQNNSDACLFFIHGNGDNARSWAHAVTDFPSDVFVLEFPGYGERPGAPSEKSIKSAALAAFEAEPIRYRKIILCGQSLGGGVTPAILDKHAAKISALVLITPFTSLSAVARTQFRYLPTSLLLKDRYPLFESWKSFPGPSYVFIAANDEVISSNITASFAREKSATRRVTIVPDAGHNTLELPHDFWRQLLAP